MNCQEWEEPIAQYCGGEMDSRRSLEVEHHLAGCAGCQIFASGMRECLEEMRAIHREEIPVAHFTAVRARVLAKLQPAPWWRRRWLPVAAMAAAVCFAVWLERANLRIGRESAPAAGPATVARHTAAGSSTRPVPPNATAGRDAHPPAAGAGAVSSRVAAAHTPARPLPSDSAPTGRDAPLPVAQAAATPPRPRKPAPPPEPLTVKIVTDDPDVVIYWIANPKGE